MTPIAEMVERMMAAGLAAEMIVLAIQTCELSTGIHRNPPDEMAEKRRAWDRERKRAARETEALSGEVHRNPPDEPKSVSSPAPPSPFPPITPLSSSPPPTPSDLEGRASARKAGSRLPLDWEPNLDDREYGRHLGLTEEMIWATAEEMKLWGEANSNRAIARKANWSATFKGFLRRAVKTPQGKSHDRRNGIQEALGSIERRASQGGSNVVGLLPVGRRE